MQLGPVPRFVYIVLVISIFIYYSSCAHYCNAKLNLFSHMRGFDKCCVQKIPVTLNKNTQNPIRQA